MKKKKIPLILLPGNNIIISKIILFDRLVCFLQIDKEQFVLKETNIKTWKCLS